MKKRLLSFVLAVLMIATLLPVTALAYTTYYINGVAVRCDDFDSSPNECWTYANNIFGASNLTHYLMTVQILFEISATVSLR